LTAKFSRRTLPEDVTYQQCLHVQRDLDSQVLHTNKPTRDTEATRKFILRWSLSPPHSWIYIPIIPSQIWAVVGFCDKTRSPQHLPKSYIQMLRA